MFRLEQIFNYFISFIIIFPYNNSISFDFKSFKAKFQNSLVVFNIKINSAALLLKL